ncbi:50S ribosomal protein L11 methyltransferase [Patescibacteria group bacterium]
MDIILLIFLIFVFLLTATALVGIVLRVPYVPTKKNVMDKVLDEISLKKGETFMDLGCGDARMLIEAEKRRKINAVGYEIAPLVYILAIIRKLMNGSKAKIHFKNFFKEKLDKADVIFCYLMPHELKRLAKKLKKECKKGTRIVSNTFKIQGLKPQRVIKKNPKEKTPTLYLYKI